MNTIVGSCPWCGAPRVFPSSWGGIIPPPSMPTCTCAADRAKALHPTTWNRPARSLHEALDAVPGARLDVDPDTWAQLVAENQRNQERADAAERLLEMKDRLLRECDTRRTELNRQVEWLAAQVSEVFGIANALLAPECMPGDFDALQKWRDQWRSWNQGIAR